MRCSWQAEISLEALRDTKISDTSNSKNNHRRMWRTRSQEAERMRSEDFTYVVESQHGAREALAAVWEAAIMVGSS